jgi:hypothetical protein
MKENSIDYYSDKAGLLIQYEEFLKSLDLFKSDIYNPEGPFGFVSGYIFQLSLAKLIHNPMAKIEFQVFKSDDNEGEESLELSNMNSLYGMIKSYLGHQDILHKILYTFNRFLMYTRKLKSHIETIKKVIEEIRAILYNDKVSSVIVNRECLRILCTLTMFSDQTLLWLKFDSRKVFVDYSNYSDIMLQYKDPETDWYPEDTEKERIIFPPYLKVKSFADKMGVIFFGEHSLIIPKDLDLGNNFTIWFRFFNPVINTRNWHVLLQPPNGEGGLIVIDSSRRILGCFTEEGEFIESGIDLSHPDLSKKWIQVSMCYSSKKEGDQKKNANKNESSKLEWYVNSNLANVYDKKINLPKVIKFVGNSKDFTQPFGVFCDVRIYKNFFTENQIKYIYIGEENRKAEKNDYDLLYYIYHKASDVIIGNFYNSCDLSEETFYFTLKFFNNIMANRSHRSKFINYNLIMKVKDFFSSKKMEGKKEVAKFLMTIS